MKISAQQIRQIIQEELESAQEFKGPRDAEVLELVESAIVNLRKAEALLEESGQEFYDDADQKEAAGVSLSGSGNPNHRGNIRVDAATSVKLATDNLETRVSHLPHAFLT